MTDTHAQYDRGTHITPDSITNSNSVVNSICKCHIKYNLQVFFHCLVFDAPRVQLTGNEANKSGDEDLEPVCFIVDTFRKLIVQVNCAP